MSRCVTSVSLTMNISIDAVSIAILYESDKEGLPLHLANFQLSQAYVLRMATKSEKWHFQELGLSEGYTHSNKTSMVQWAKISFCTLVSPLHVHFLANFCCGLRNLTWMFQGGSLAWSWQKIKIEGKFVNKLSILSFFDWLQRKLAYMGFLMMWPWIWWSFARIIDRLIRNSIPFIALSANVRNIFQTPILTLVYVTRNFSVFFLKIVNTFNNLPSSWTRCGQKYLYKFWIPPIEFIMNMYTLGKFSILHKL